MDILLLRFDAPLLSFGAPVVDNLGVIQPFPALSMLAGLLGNALGYDHREFQKLQRLQERLSYASRCDRPGELLRDYQTADLGQNALLSAAAWTTWGRLDERKGGPASKGTHIRHRDYWADSVHTVALTLDPAIEHPDLDALAAAVEQPERPLFVGRKCCLPAEPLLIARQQSPSLLEALRHLRRIPEERSGVPAGEGLACWWPEETEDPDEDYSRRVPVTDERDWQNRVHCGQRMMRHGLLLPPEAR